MDKRIVGAAVTVVVVSFLFTAGIVAAKSNGQDETEDTRICLEHTENYVNGRLVSVCDVVDGVAVSKDTNGTVEATAVLSAENIREIQSRSCQKNIAAARVLISTPRRTSTLAEVIERQAALETIVNTYC